MNVIHAGCIFKLSAATDEPARLLMFLLVHFCAMEKHAVLTDGSTKITSDVCP